jgi:hypothetical protein
MKKIHSFLVFAAIIVLTSCSSLPERKQNSSEDYLAILSVYLKDNIEMRQRPDCGEVIIRNIENNKEYFSGIPLHSAFFYFPNIIPGEYILSGIRINYHNGYYNLEVVNLESFNQRFIIERDKKVTYCGYYYVTMDLDPNTNVLNILFSTYNFIYKLAKIIEKDQENTNALNAINAYLNENKKGWTLE